MNPNNDDSSRNWMDGEIIGLEGAEVTTAPSHTPDDDINHHIEVKPDTFNEPIPAEVKVEQKGDVSIPTEGSRVIVGYRVNGRPLVLGSRYAKEESVPEYEAGERVIGHPLSDAHIRLASDGSVRVEADNGNTIELESGGSVVVNDGNTQPVTDVSTTSDTDGYVTNVSLTRADGVFVPSQ